MPVVRSKINPVNSVTVHIEGILDILQSNYSSESVTPAVCLGKTKITL